VRRLHRSGIVPPTLATKGARTTADHVLRREATPAADLTFPEHWNEPDVRGALHAMQGWACAHCQRALENSRGDVDHFRPKKGGEHAGHPGYWWLAYATDNLFLTCRVCNSTYKRNLFPLEPGALRADVHSPSGCAAEARILVDPVEDPVDRWIRVDWMESEHEALVKPVTSLPANSTARRRAEASIDFFRLNKDQEVLRERIEAIREAARAIRRNDDEARLRVHRLACRFLAHGAAVHNFVEDCAPEWLPTPREKLRILLSILKDRLARALRTRRSSLEPPVAERDILETAWTLAVVWASPPPGTMTSADVEVWLRDQDFFDLVDGLVTTLHLPGE
jgi:uncharacterized protein (TIGR02646 family)